MDLSKDGTHVGVKRPSLKAGDFINKNIKFTLTIQAAADNNYCFFERKCTRCTYIFKF